MMTLRAFTLLLLLSSAATPAPVPPAPPALGPADAEALAGRWWGPYHRGDARHGAAWVLPQAYTHAVTMLDAHPWVRVTSDGPKDVFQVGVCDGRQAAWNITRAPDALYYVGVIEFGSGDSWEGAFYDALQRGNRPLVGRATGFDRDMIVDASEESRFRRDVRRPAVVRKESP